jgi:MFS family permease
MEKEETSNKRKLSNIVKRIFKKKKKIVSKNNLTEEIPFDDEDHTNKDYLIDKTNEERDSKYTDSNDNSNSTNNYNNINPSTSNYYNINSDSIINERIDESSNNNIELVAQRNTEKKKSKKRKFLNIINLDEYIEEKEKIKNRKILLGKLKIICSIDQLYFNIGEEKSKYFEFYVGWILSLCVFCATYTFWSIIEQRSTLKNPVFCWDSYMFEYKVCEKSAICTNNQTKDIKNTMFYLNQVKLYDLCKTYRKKDEEYYNAANFNINLNDIPSNDDSNDSNSTKTSTVQGTTDPFKEMSNLCVMDDSVSNFIQELKIINLVFKDFTTREYLAFAESSKLVANIDTKNMNYFQSVIILTTNSNFLLESYIERICYNHKMNVAVNWVLFNISGFLIGSLCLAILSDYLGRKKLLLTGLIMISISSIIVFILYLISSFTYDVDLTNYNNDLKNHMEKSVINSIGTKINEYFIKIINELTSIKLTTLQKEIFTNKIQVFILVADMIASIGTSLTMIVTLSLSVESALNFHQLYANYQRFMFGIISSHLVFFILYRLINNFAYFHLTLLVISIICIVLVINFIRESPRYLFEYANYKELTSVILEKTKIKDLDRYLIEDTNQVFKQEFELYEKVEFHKLLSLQSLLILDNHKEGVYSPLSFLKLISKNKKLIKNSANLFALTMIVSTSYYLVLNNYSRKEIDTEFIYEREIFFFFSSYIVLLDIYKLISLFIFSFIHKYFGMKIILTVCFVGSFISSLVLGIIEFYKQDITDYDNYYPGYFIINYNNIPVFKFFLSFLVVFSIGPFVSLFFHIIRFTKTIYRCTVLGIFFIVFQAGGYVSFNLYIHIESSMLYITIINFVGFIISIFLEEDIEEAAVSDYRKIKINQ